MRCLICVLSIIFTANSAWAHDFWIEPEQYQLEPNESLTITFKVGHGGDQSAWPLERRRIVGLRSLSAQGLMDHQDHVPSKPSDGTVTIDPLPEGAHVIWTETTNSFSELPADRFNKYVEEEGILPILDHRSSGDHGSKSGTELYSRRGKTLIRVGNQRTDSQHLTTPVGATLEIVPIQDPFELEAQAEFSVRVLYYGRPASNATIHVTQLDNPDNTMTLIANENGVARLDSLSNGQWMFHTVWAMPADNLLTGAQYSTIFASLSFEKS